MILRKARLARIGVFAIFFVANLFGCAVVGDYFGVGRWEKSTAAPAAPVVEKPLAAQGREILPVRAVLNDGVPTKSGQSPVPPPPATAETVTVSLAPARDDQPPSRIPLPGNSRIAPRDAGVPSERIYRDVVLDEDTTWRGEVAVEGSLTILPQTTLTIEPGTIVRFRRMAAGAGNGPVLLVQGRLVVRGTAESPVRFTSAFAEPQPGDWEGIVFLGSEKRNSLENCHIEGAATGIDAAFSSLTLKQVVFMVCGTGARLRTSVVAVEGGAAEGCSVGIELDDSEADVHDFFLRGNRQGIVARDSSLGMERGSVVSCAREGLVATGSRIKIDSVRFEKNSTGIVFDDSEGTVAGGRIADNRDAGIVMARSQVKIVGNDISSNGSIGLRVADGKGIAWGNVFSANGRHDIFNGGGEDFRASANWWGDLASFPLDERVFDQKDDPTRGKVLFLPPLKTRPLLPSLNSIAK